MKALSVWAIGLTWALVSASHAGSPLSNDPSPLAVCQDTIRTAAVRLAAEARRGLGACLTRGVECVAGDAAVASACCARGAERCANDLTKVERARRRFRTQVAHRRCSDVPFADVLSSLGYERIAERCAALSPPETVGDLGSLVACLDRLLVGATACPIGTLELPRAAEGLECLGLVDDFLVTGEADLATCAVTSAASPTPSPAATATSTPIVTATRTATPITTVTPALSVTATRTPTPLATATPSASTTPTTMASATRTATPTAVPPTVTATIASPTATATAAIATATVTPPSAATPTVTKTTTPAPTATATFVAPTVTATALATTTATRTATPVATTTPTKTATPVPTATATATPQPTVTATRTATPVPTATATRTATPVPTATVTPGGPVCGNGTKETGEDCDDGNTLDCDECPSTCKTAPPDCTATTTRGPQTVRLRPPAGQAITSGLFCLRYPAGTVGLPGTGLVTQRASGFQGTTSLNDFNNAVRVGLLGRNVLSEATVTLSFDLCAGATAPPPTAFDCHVVSASNAGVTLEPATVECTPISGTP